MTLTDKDLELFSIDKFITHCSKLDGVGILLMIHNFSVLVQGIRQDIYTNEIVRDFTFFISHLENIVTKKHEMQKPIGMSEENFFKITAIIDKLVIAGYLKKD